MSDDDSNYKIRKTMETVDMDSRQNIEIEVHAPEKDEVLELYDEAMNQ